MLSTPILLACIIVMISAAFVLIVQKTSANVIPGASKYTNRAPTFIIAGLPQTGKTALFNLLTTDSVKPSVMSQEPNVAEDYMLPTSHKNFKFKLIDFPGHDKFRSELLQTIKDSSQLKGLIYVIDSTINPKELVSTAELLYEILSVTELRPDGVDILLACNKSESFVARPPSKIKGALEKEITEIMKRKAKSLKANSKKSLSDDANDDDDDEVAVLQQNSAGFEFDRIDGNVDAKEGSVLKNDIDKWECWIDERAMN
ncbi:Signal recognition particle receptor subunit beta [Kluyveromyces lactis]|uniref:Signal recognition particle receptor subunit beta n=1 Tax=Kluyveromyces lactis (strain ATCC 8585 / CBS 2359 / DSM 70799 / NBRC 1267 / NRRL Y-1140 / WM37) TaxID=284590 RepID=Q6CNK9_KLULA|nr:uncharacterized protein KLLA0_E11705g [Kluyveromyces lactis]CAG99567.1 KLLA0E11705p [Kluyveromyces lactis]|eukprot:XP_454480.1 uncharacterized protein KLLA0_E11705g [Kluyveromyces lactis]